MMSAAIKDPRSVEGELRREEQLLIQHIKENNQSRLEEERAIIATVLPYFSQDAGGAASKISEAVRTEHASIAAIRRLDDYIDEQDRSFEAAYQLIQDSCHILSGAKSSSVDAHALVATTATSALVLDTAPHFSTFIAQLKVLRTQMLETAAEIRDLLDTCRFQEQAAALLEEENTETEARVEGLIRTRQKSQQVAAELSPSISSSRQLLRNRLGLRSSEVTVDDIEAAEHQVTELHLLQEQNDRETAECKSYCTSMMNAAKQMLQQTDALREGTRRMQDATSEAHYLLMAHEQEIDTLRQAIVEEELIIASLEDRMNKKESREKQLENLDAQLHDAVYSYQHNVQTFDALLESIREDEEKERTLNEALGRAQQELDNALEEVSYLKCLLGINDPTAASVVSSPSLTQRARREHRGCGE